MNRTSGRRSLRHPLATGRAPAAAAAVAVAGWLVTAAPAAAQLVFTCASAGADCEAELMDGSGDHSSSLVVPGGACAKVGAVKVRLAVRHDWVGDLRATLSHGGRSATLLDRPGLDAALPFGCPGSDVDVVVDDAAADDIQQACEVTIPAVSGARHSHGHQGRLLIVPDGSPFHINNCPFERFDGAFVGLQQGDVIMPAPFCPLFFDDDTTGALPCVFRGRWNDTCGNANLLARFTSDGNLVRLAILNLNDPVEFRGTVPAPTTVDLDELQIGNQVSARDGDAFLQLGLEALAGLACAGTWTLTVADAAAPNSGMLTGWALEIVPENTPTATPTVTPTASATATASATSSASATATPSATPSVSATASATATPSATGLATETPTATRTLAPTGTATELPTGAATQTATQPTATPTVSTGETPPTGTATAAPDVCIGDCDGDRRVAINEVIIGVNIALDQAALATCAAFDANASGAVEINELVGGVRSALDGCPA
jgi:subtilisin-like proprotein convertase family protein